MAADDAVDEDVTGVGGADVRGAAGRAPRAGLPARVLCAAAAVLALGVAAVGVVNLRAADAFSQATSRLKEDIAAVAGETPDYDRLATLQGQVDAQFADAGAAGVLLLPSLRADIAANADVSQRLTRLIAAELAGSDDGSSADDATSDGGSDGSGDAGDSGDSADDGLTDEQRRQIEELLASNEQSTDLGESQTTDKSQTTTNNTGNTSKPW
ncbi:DUF6466 family protein [Bifidobacterium samirii]|nr:DUF6466 family protein [Bifidobacterium samirii]